MWLLTCLLYRFQTAFGPQQPRQAQTLSFCAFSRVGLDVPVIVLFSFRVEKETVKVPQLQFFDKGRCCLGCSLELQCHLDGLCTLPSDEYAHAEQPGVGSNTNDPVALEPKQERPQHQTWAWWAQRLPSE